MQNFYSALGVSLILSTEPSKSPIERRLVYAIWMVVSVVATENRFYPTFNDRR